MTVSLTGGASAGLATIHLCQSPAILRHLTKYTLAWVDERDSEGRTLLMHASARGHAEVISEALALGASPAMVDHHKRNALHHAAIHVRSSRLQLDVALQCTDVHFVALTLLLTTFTQPTSSDTFVRPVTPSVPMREG
jgi:hypothetical protein